jgi:AcrR family transcriptional regulator
VEAPQGEKADEILRAVVELLISDGYDAVQLRSIARHAHVSVRTIYKYFPTREELLLSAVAMWMQENAYSALADPPVTESLYEELMWGLRAVFQPWEHNPRMLEAFHYICVAPGGDRLRAQAFAAMGPANQHLRSEYDAAYAADIAMIIMHVSQAAIGMFVAREIEVTGILPIIERTVLRLTSDNTSTAIRRRT